MPAELATPLSFERDAEEDPQVRIEAAEALYLLALQVSFPSDPKFILEF